MPIISFKLNEKLFLRDPQTSELGQEIIRYSIKLIDTGGFELFTFKKLAEKIGSTEASVYRYFENKHRLLIYLIDWYWSWIEHRLDFSLQNLTDPEVKMKICLRILVEEKQIDPQFGFVDEAALQRIVMSEFDKTYLTRQVDADNREGLFLPYKVVCKKVAAIASELNPNYQHPQTLISTVMLSINHQLFYAKHLPSLTNIKADPKKQYQKLQEFCETIVFNSLRK